jgi:sulfocyanin SoxE-like protein
MIWMHGLRPCGVAALLSTGLACASRSQTPPPTQSSSQPDSTARPSTQPVEWLLADTVERTAKLTLEVTAPPNTPSALINGLRSGGGRIIVPVQWTMQWDWRNADPGSPHSLVVMVQREKIPLEGGRPSFSNAMTRMVTEGLPPGQTDHSSFEAEEPGWYWLLCGVPGHALKGEWLELRVDPAAGTASVQTPTR